jgi:hypothetical protein
MLDGIFGPFFHESTTTNAVYLDMLENFVLPQIVAEAGSFFNKMVHQPILVPLYALLWTDGFLVDGSAGDGRLNGPHGLLT